MDNCPCGLGKEYLNCCGPFHTGNATAPTAESLMRSRYSAFVTNNIDYIMETFSEKSRADVNRDEIKQWAEESHWKGLDIIKTEQGAESDASGIVEFKASYESNGKSITHHERSFFEKENNRWFFVDGEIIQDSYRREAPKVGRNDPCPCGSGKKYKKCCLN